MTAALESIKSVEISDWKTLNTASSPTKLENGQTPNAKNVWVDEKPGSVITANGYIKVGQIPSGNPVTFCINYFKTSSGTQTFVVSDNSTVWTTLDFQTFTSIITGLSSAFQLRGAVIRDKLWLTNGSDSVRTFDGASVVVLDGSGSTPTVPKGRYIAYHDERIWLYHVPSNRSQVAFSALTDSSGTVIAPDNASAWPAANTIQISEGDADFGTGLLLYRGYLHFFKQYSVWRLVGYDEYTYSRVKTRASSGCRFYESIQVLVSLVHLIGFDGLYVFDGEETSRISDIIDPATASQTAFGFNQLQQPNSNNLFWEISATADWNTGTVPANSTIDDSLKLKAFDDVQADFAAGVTQTNVDTSTNPDNLQLALVASGSSSVVISSGKTATLTNNGSLSLIGNTSYITDGDLTRNVGFLNTADNTSMDWSIDLGLTYAVSRVIIKNFYFERQDSSMVTSQFKIQSSPDGSSWTDQGTVTPPASGSHSGGSPIFVNPSLWFSTTVQDITVDFNTAAARYWRLLIVGNKGYYVVTDIQVYQAGFHPTGRFVSRTLDLGATPNSLGNFNASIDLGGGTASFFTQSSADGISWDAEVSCVNGGVIGSTPRRYLRWGVDLTNGASGVTSPVIAAVYLPTVYYSAIHNTGGSIYAWGPFEAERSPAGQTINFYYRTATTSIGVSSATWNILVPGGAITDAVLNQYVQFKIEILGGTDTSLPAIQSVTINWIVGSGTQPQTLQNVASYVWRNRYWLAAAGPSASANDTVIIRGKKTFGSPWQLKDWPILSFTRYQDGFYGGSSIDGSIFRIDTGYSKNSVAMNSYFETGDFLFGGFYINIIEVLIEVERLGPYSLSVGISTDRGATFTEKTVDLTVSTFAPSFVKRLNFNVTCDRFRMRVRVNGADQPFQVHRLVAFYNQEASRGSIK